MVYVWKYLITVGVFFGIDLVWLGVISKNFYAKQIGHLMAKEVNMWAAMVFYLMYIVGIMVFVTLPFDGKSWGNLFIKGALFGLMAYGTYDLTNLAVLRNWPILVTVVDMIWGAVLTGSVSVVSVWLWQRFVG